jgi:hypothetical protein
MASKSNFKLSLIVRANSDGKKSEILVNNPEGSEPIGPEFDSKYLHQQDFTLNLFRIGGKVVVALHWFCIPWKPLELEFDPPFDKAFNLDLDIKIDGDKGEISIDKASLGEKLEYGTHLTVLDSKTCSVHLGEISGKLSVVLYQAAGCPRLVCLDDL